MTAKIPAVEPADYDRLWRHIRQPLAMGDSSPSFVDRCIGPDRVETMSGIPRSHVDLSGRDWQRAIGIARSGGVEGHGGSKPLPTCSASELAELCRSPADSALAAASRTPAEALPGLFSQYALTRIFRVTYIQSMESVFEIFVRPNRPATLHLLVSPHQAFGETQPIVSKHLHVLRETGRVQSNSALRAQAGSLTLRRFAM